MLEVKIQSLLDGAKKAEGIAVIVDVFRAGTNISLILNKGADKIIPVADLQYSEKLKKEHPSYIFTGEREGKKINWFEYGNSPSEIDTGYFNNKTVSINTMSGTQGIVNAKSADQILVSGFTNSYAVEQYILSQINKYSEPIVTIVPMGWGGTSPALEDELYAEYLRDRLLKKEPDYEQIRNQIMNSDFVKRTFLNDNNADFPKKDLEYCLALNKYNNVPKVYKTENGLEIRDALKYESQ